MRDTESGGIMAMSIIGWKLIFKYKDLAPGQRCTCVVIPRYPFRGRYFMFAYPEQFAISDFRIGTVSELMANRDTPVPCVVLNAQDILLSTAMPSMVCSIEAVNIGKETLIKGNVRHKTHLETTSFYAELYGELMVDGEELPEDTEHEKRSLVRR